MIRQTAAQKGHCNVFVVACVSQNREGKQLAEIGQLVEAGAVGFSDDGAPVYDAELMRRAFEYCLMFDKPVMNHAEVRELSQKGVMHEGLVSLMLGLPGIPAAAEDVMISRDISLAEATGGRLHIMHVSTVRRRRDRCGGRSPAASASRPKSRRTTSRSPTSACGASIPTTR